MVEQESYSFKKLICTQEGERLWYAEKTDGNNKTYEIYNQSENQLLGTIEKIRNGTWMHWSLVIPPHIMRACIDKGEALTFSPGCQDEIREFCKKLNGSKNNEII